MTGDDLDTLTDEDLAALPDATLQELAGDCILASAVMNRFPKFADRHHRRVDRVYGECRRRARGVYQRAFNEVVRSQGHHGMATEPREGDA